MYNYKELTDEEIEYVTVTTVEELSNGQRLIFEVDNLPIALFNIAGKYFAIADVCSHDDGPVAEGEVDGYEVECPRHGSEFNLETGEPDSFPATKPVPVYEVIVEGDQATLVIEDGEE